LTVLPVLFLLASVGFLGYPAFTDLWQEHLQSDLTQQLRNPNLRGMYLADKVPDGSALTRIIIPKIGVNVVVVQGTSETDLMAGAGHYIGTPLPCSLGDVAIAGHRTTYGRPFYNVNLLTPGDLIEFQTPAGTCSYRVSQMPFRVLPNDVGVVNPTPGEGTLTLTSCAPRYSASHRIVIKAVLQGPPLVS
jgi:sortase A